MVQPTVDHNCSWMAFGAPAQKYAKPLSAFSDALAAVRFGFWRQPTFHVSRLNQHIAKQPKVLFSRFAEALCYST
ncbi:MAG: hypothetical protein M1434_04405 [Chloroflexi bacterium]|nr:hypothetical protein [Chloroflexota bacterium]MCL5273975.1 hypothetical protein [Chloroflexota bacterium]